jgi:hypothetical protein
MSYETKELVARFKASGLAQKEFCEKNSVPRLTLQYHLQRFKEKVRQPRVTLPGFIPVSIPKASGSASSIILVRGNFTAMQIAEMIKEALN